MRCFYSQKKKRQLGPLEILFEPLNTHYSLSYIYMLLSRLCFARDNLIQICCCLFQENENKIQINGIFF
jgi:hypothetical protein